MKCKNCDRQLPDYVMEAVEDGELDEVIAYKQSEEDGATVSRTDYFCNPECLSEHFQEDDSDTMVSPFSPIVRRLDRARFVSEDPEVLNILHRLREDIIEDSVMDPENTELRGDELSAYTEGGGIIRENVWALKILPSENLLEIHTADHKEPEEHELDNFLETWENKIEIVNYEYLKEIMEDRDDE